MQFWIRATALLFALALAPAAALAGPTLELIWTATSGTGTPGGSSIEAAPGDILVLDIVVNIDSAGFGGASVSLGWTDPLTVPGPAEECPSPPNFAPGVCTSLNGAVYVPPFPGVVVGAQTASSFDAGSVGLPEFAPSLLTLGRITLTAGADDTVSVFYLPAVDLVFDASGGGVPSFPLASAEIAVSEVCSNALDDDGDGFVDLQDPGCWDAFDPLETHARPGDVLVSNFDDGTVSALDPVTGRLARIGSIDPARNAYGLDVDGDGGIVVNEYQGGGTGAVSEIDLETGARSEISVGGDLVTPNGLAIDANGDLFVGESTNDVVLHIDRVTGVQTRLTSLGDPNFIAIDDILIDPADGSLLISDIVNGIYRASDPLGAFTVTPFGGTFFITRPRQMAFDASGDVVMADEIFDAPIRLDPAAGVDVPMLASMPFSFLWGAAREPSGLALFSDRTTGLISRVDELALTHTPINFGSPEPGLAHLAAVPDDHDLTLELTDAILVDGGTLDEVDVGDTLELTAVVTNTGAGSADLLSLESGLDPNLTLVASSLSTTQGTIIEGSLASDPRLEVDLGSLAPAASATVTWEVVVGDPAPAKSVSANAWIRREKLILAESDDPTTGPAPDANVIPVGDYGIVVQATQKISDVRGALSGTGNPGSLLLDGDLFGSEIEPLGDLDGDGIPDAAVSARSDDDGVSGAGAVYILLLNADGSVKERTKLSATSGGLDTALANHVPPLTLSDDSFGESIAYLGDLDGAGPSDFALAVGADGDDTGGTDRGAVYILFMDADAPIHVMSLEKIASGDFTGTIADGDLFGSGVANLGDVDGDGVVDLAVGSRGDSTAGTDAGAVWILFLTSSGAVDSSPMPQRLTAPASASDRFGWGLSALGDLDGNAVADLAVGAHRRNGGGLVDSGAVWILTLDATGAILTQTEISSGNGGMPPGLLEAGDRFGWEVERLPDLDDDGVPELAVGTPRDDDISTDTGALYVLYLTPSGMTDRVEKVLLDSNALDDGDDVGLGLATLGDLDGDGNPEIAVGANRDDDGGIDRGGVYVLHTATPVPEPSVLLGLASGIAFLATIGRGRMRHS